MPGKNGMRTTPKSSPVQLLRQICVFSKREEAMTNRVKTLEKMTKEVLTTDSLSRPTSLCKFFPLVVPYALRYLQILALIQVWEEKNGQFLYMVSHFQPCRILHVDIILYFVG
jgi:hypothetical protein